MSNLPKVLVIMAFSVLWNTARADWQADAAHLAEPPPNGGGIDTTTPINELKNDLDKFKPPQPCVDKNPQTYTLGSPATLNCGSGSGSSSSGGATGKPSDSTVDQQQKGSGKTFDIMN